MTELKTEKIEFTEEDQQKIVETFPEAIFIFDNPSGTVQAIAYRKNPDVIKLIKNIHPSLELMEL